MRKKPSDHPPSSDMPRYPPHAIYATLVTLCEQAGMQVTYAALPAGLYARSRGTTIQLPAEDARFSSVGQATIVLGHELAHFFVNPQFTEESFQGYEHDMNKHMLLESECDKLGAYFAMLARQIAATEAAREIAEGLNPR